MLPVETKQTLTIQACLYIIPVLLHSFGLYLLFTVKHLGSAEDQKFYLKNLSFAELSYCIVKMSHRILPIYGYHRLAFQIWVFQTNVLFAAYTFIMIAITVDRFLSVYLNIKYQVLITKTKIHCSIMICWLLAIMLYLILIFTMPQRRIRYITVIYVWPTEEFLFLTIAVPVYLYIFYKIQRNRVQMKETIRTLSRSTTTHLPTLDYPATVPARLEIRKRKRFIKKVKNKVYIPTLLITTFVLFWVVSDQAELVLTLKGSTIPPKATLAFNLSYIIAVCSDALIYIFGIRNVKVFITKKFLPHSKEKVERRTSGTSFQGTITQSNPAIVSDHEV